MERISEKQKGIFSKDIVLHGTIDQNQIPYIFSSLPEASILHHYRL